MKKILSKEEYNGFQTHLIYLIREANSANLSFLAYLLRLAGEELHINRVDKLHLENEPAIARPPAQCTPCKI